MSLVMRRHDGRSVLGADCDVCRRPITNALLAGYCWSDHERADRAQIVILHKGSCMDFWEDFTEALSGGSFRWMELSDMPVYFGLAFSIPVERTRDIPEHGTPHSIGVWGQA